MTEIGGPVLTKEGVAHLLGIGEEEVEEMVSRGEILELPTTKPDQPCYPEFQFRASQEGDSWMVEVVPYLCEVTAALRESTNDSWKVAAFLTASAAAADAKGHHDPRSYVERLWAGDHEAVLAAAVAASERT